jgi:hypothetical protein
VAACGARAAGGNAGDRVLEVALQPVVGARLAVSIVVIAINFNRSRAGMWLAWHRRAATSRVWSIANRNWPQSNITRVVYRQPELAAKQVEPSFPN